MSDQNNDEDLDHREYRQEFMAARVKAGICYQIQALREQFALTQLEFAEKIGTTQSAVSRLESADYGKVSVRTLLEIAKALDIALVVKFVSFPRFLHFTDNASPESLKVEPYEVSRDSKSRFASKSTTRNDVVSVPSAKQISFQSNTSNAGVVRWQERKMNFLYKPSQEIPGANITLKSIATASL